MPAPQRFLANDRNIFRTAAVAPSGVLPIANRVLEIPVARAGTVQAALTGSYSGNEEAVYDVEIINTTIGTKNISAPIFSGKGSGTIDDVGVTTAAAQTFTVELGDAGIPTTFAGVDFEGVALRARATGAAGNAVHMTINQSPLMFTATAFSLLADLAAGSGGTNGLEGPAFDWQSAVLGADNLIPSSAKRVAFGADRSAIYLQYKRYIDGKWTYHFVPEIAREVPKGTPVYFVTGGRTVTISDGGSPAETLTGIVTLYDLLNGIKQNSALIEVLGVVANDRSPTGQASRELLTRTDAHAEPSSGHGSSAATGFANVSVQSNASTELITATCFAIAARDNPLAHLGAERWKVTGSLSGDLGTAVTGVPFATSTFAFTIPQKLPTEYSGNKGKFDVSNISYVARGVGESEPPLCVVAMSLGPSAFDQTITLEYTARPSGNCLCDALPVPNLNTACLGGNTEGGSMSYSDDVVARLVDLYDWQADTVRAQSQYDAEGHSIQAPFLEGSYTYPSPAALTTGAVSTTSALGFSPAYIAAQESLLALVSKFESAIALIDPIPDTGSPLYRAAALSAWDTALTELKADVASAGSDQSFTAKAYENLVQGDGVSIIVDGTGAKQAKKGYLSGAADFGFVDASFSAGATATIYRWGIITTTGLSAGGLYTMQTNGSWNFGTGQGISGQAISTTKIEVFPPQGSTASAVYWGLLPARYNTRLQWALISGGVSPLGKSDASVQESGDGCWQDWGDPFYWTVVGSDGAYAPAFNNHPYYASRKATAKGKYFSTHEFAFQVNVKCPANLKPGDRITLVIGGAAWGATYQIGDELELPIIAAGPLSLAGGQNGNDTQTWYVSGDVSGAFPAYLYGASSPVSYDEDGLQFMLTPGGVPFGVGDKFQFSVVGGHFRWRATVGGAVGAWSSAQDITGAAVPLDAGLSLSFTQGVAPSLVAGDLFQFRALQPWAASNMQTPTRARWQWPTNSPDMADAVFDCGSVKVCNAFSIALHTLPDGATITVEGGTSPGVYLWSENIPWQAGVMLAVLSASRSARYFRLTVEDGAGGGIGWFWGGNPWTPELSANVLLRRDYKVERDGSGGLNQGGVFLGKAISGTVDWDEGAMSDADNVALSALLDWVKSNHDEPFVFVPQVTRPSEALIVRVLPDAVELPEVWDYNKNAGLERRFSARLPLQGLWQQ